MKHLMKGLCLVVLSMIFVTPGFAADMVVKGLIYDAATGLPVTSKTETIGVRIVFINNTPKNLVLNGIAFGVPQFFTVKNNPALINLSWPNVSMPQLSNFNLAQGGYSVFGEIDFPISGAKIEGNSKVLKHLPAGEYLPLFTMSYVDPGNGQTVSYLVKTETVEVD